MITVRQFSPVVTDTSPVSSITATLPAPAVAGNTLAMILGTDKSAGSFSAPTGGGWTLPINSPTTSVSLGVALKMVAAGGETSVTMGYSGTRNGRAILVELEGDNPIQFDQATSASSGSNGLTQTTGTIATTHAAASFGLVAFANDSAKSDPGDPDGTVTWTGAFTTFASAFSASPSIGEPAFAVGSGAVTGGAAAESTATYNDGNADQTIAAILTFYESASAFGITTAPDDIVRGGSGSVTVSGAAVTPTTGNTTLTLEGESLTVTGVTGTGPYAIAFDTPSGIALQHDDITGYDLEVTVGSESDTQAEVTLSPRAGYSSVDLSSPESVDTASILSGYVGDTPVTGDQVEHESSSSPEGIPVSVSSAGYVTFETPPTVTNTVSRRVIQADGTVGAESDWTASMDSEAAPSDATQSNQVTEPTVTTIAPVAPDGVTQGSTIDESTSGSLAEVPTAGVTQGQPVDVPDVAAEDSVPVDGLTQGQPVAVSGVASEGAVPVDGISQGQPVDVSALATEYGIEPADILQAQPLDESSGSSSWSVIPAEVAQASTLDSPTLATDYEIAAAGISQSNAVAATTLGGVFIGELVCTISVEYDFE